MEPRASTPRPQHITAILTAQIATLNADDARRIETLHRAVRLDDNPAFSIAVAHLVRSGRERDWQEAQTAIWKTIEARELPQRVRYAAWDAALALLTRDFLDQDAFRNLYGPWAGGRDEHVLSLD